LATTDLIGAQTRTDHAVAAPTAPLPPAAVEALAALIPRFPLVQAVTEYETAAVHAAQLAGLAESGRMTDLDADSLAVAEDLMAAAKAKLDAAGRLDLIEVAA
jgi:predicted HAD superfamily phosphohydrolase